MFPAAIFVATILAISSSPAAQAIPLHAESTPSVAARQFSSRDTLADNLYAQLKREFTEEITRRTDSRGHYANLPARNVIDSPVSRRSFGDMLGDLVERELEERQDYEILKRELGDSPALLLARDISHLLERSYGPHETPSLNRRGRIIPKIKLHSHSDGRATLKIQGFGHKVKLHVGSNGQLTHITHTSPLGHHTSHQFNGGPHTPQLNPGSTIPPQLPQPEQAAVSDPLASGGSPEAVPEAGAPLGSDQQQPLDAAGTGVGGPGLTDPNQQQFRRRSLINQFMRRLSEDISARSLNELD